jgi:DNA mismatch repair protein MutL
MPKVQVLSPDVANQIAAGEVIERPANAVKELVENALDAGARRVEIEIEEGGKKLIRVRDDGCGMSAEDAVLSLQRHATSKLQNADDLYSVRTLGFRGEALPSMAAVSRFEITTRETDADIGTHVQVEAGVVTDISETGCREGTEIAIHNLFFNTPARFKFLKSDQAEAARISEIVGHLALAYPHVAFRLRHNGNELLRAEAGGNPLNAVAAVFGREVARQMLPIAVDPEKRDEKSGEVVVSGFAGRPQLTRANRNGQLFFVNGRIIQNRSMQHAVTAAYEGLLHGHGRFPLVVLFVQLPTGAVDVNVHPTKSEVRFAREWEVHHATRVAIRETLVSAQIAPDWGFSNPNYKPAPPAANVPSPNWGGAVTGPFGSRLADSRFDAMRSHDLSTQHDMSTQSAAKNAFENHSPSSQLGGEASTHNGANAFSNRLFPIPEEIEEKRQTLRPLAQISNNAYILCEGEDGLYIVCQHRAHERILADKALEAAEGKPVESQRLVVPFTVEAGPRALAAVEENTTLLNDLGFEVEAFGGASLLVRAVPYLVAKRDYETAFADLLDELVSGQGGKNLQDRRRALLTMLSCKNAIKAGDPLAPEQMKALVDDLLQLPNPGICPHGQPILIKISTLELDKKFEREYASR